MLPTDAMQFLLVVFREKILRILHMIFWNNYYYIEK